MSEQRIKSKRRSIQAQIRQQKYLDDIAKKIYESQEELLRKNQSFIIKERFVSDWLDDALYEYIKSRADIEFKEYLGAYIDRAAADGRVPRLLKLDTLENYYAQLTYQHTRDICAEVVRLLSKESPTRSSPSSKTPTNEAHSRDHVTSIAEATPTLDYLVNQWAAIVGGPDRNLHIFRLYLGGKTPIAIKAELGLAQSPDEIMSIIHEVQDDLKYYLHATYLSRMHQKQTQKAN